MSNKMPLPAPFDVPVSAWLVGYAEGYNGRPLNLKGFERERFTEYCVGYQEGQEDAGWMNFEPSR